MTSVFEHPFEVRYMEVDAQGVVFNAWYLTYFDNAMTAFLQRNGTRYEELVQSGYDTQVVHAELNWKSGLRWQEQAVVEVRAGTVGTTSFTLDFIARGDDDRTACIGSIVYVVISAESGTKMPVPLAITELLG